MKYIQLILGISLVVSSVSVKAEGRQNFIPQEVMAKVGPVVEKAGRVAKKSAQVAKVGAYGALTGAAGVAMVVPLIWSKILVSEALASEGNIQTGFDKASAAILVPSSFFGLGVATLYFGQKTKQAVQELKTA